MCVSQLFIKQENHEMGYNSREAEDLDLFFPIYTAHDDR